jgi:hypothetical protein
MCFYIHLFQYFIELDLLAILLIPDIDKIALNLYLISYFSFSQSSVYSSQ